MYLTSAYKAYIKENDLSLYSTKAMVIPRPELYMVYTGNQVHVPEVMRLADLYEGHGDADVTVKVLRGEDDSILGQYVAFCKIADEQRALYGLTRETIQETMRICQEQGILIPFLASRRKEVIDIMEMLFSQEEVWEMTKRELEKNVVSLYQWDGLWFVYWDKWHIKKWVRYQSVFRKHRNNFHV